MNLTHVLNKTLTDSQILTAILETLGTILLGFWLRKKGKINEHAVKALTTITMTVALPLLALTAFMTPLDHQTMVQSFAVLFWGLAIYPILIPTLPFLFYRRYSKDEQSVLGILTSFGSTTFFGLPIAGAIYGSRGIMYASVFNIGYRVFLYSYAYIKMSGEKMRGEHIKKMFVNPIVLATLIGLVLWLLQNNVPTIYVPSQSVAFYRIDVTWPWLFNWFKLLAGLASPLAWLAIGANLAQMPLSAALKNKTAWYYSTNKIILVPIIMIALLAAGSATHLLTIDHVAFATMVIMMATPVATVAVNYAIAFNHQSLLASNASLISTIFATLALPFWIITVQLLANWSIFR